MHLSTGAGYSPNANAGGAPLNSPAPNQDSPDQHRRRASGHRSATSGTAGRVPSGVPVAGAVAARPVRRPPVHDDVEDDESGMPELDRSSSDEEQKEDSSSASEDDDFDSNSPRNEFSER